MAKKGTTVAEFRKEESDVGDDVDIRRKYYAVREDGTILVKNQVHFRESAHRKAYWHDWGWKLATRQSGRRVIRSAARAVEQIAPQLLEKGFERTQ